MRQEPSPPRRSTRRRVLTLAAGGVVTAGAGGALTRLLLAGNGGARQQRPKMEPVERDRAVAAGGPPAGVGGVATATAVPATMSAASPASTPAAPLVTATPTAPAGRRLSNEQHVGQLFMVGLQSGASDAEQARVRDAITSYHAGSLVLFGSGWSGAGLVRSSVAPLQQLALDANGGVGLFVSGNQEGGKAGSFQAFYGPGFSPIPRPIDQAQGDPAALQSQAETWGAELFAAGVNLNLAPVLDTVPPGTEAANAPIGYWGREYGTDPQTVAAYGVAFEQGMRAASIAVAIKHFPGLGRVTGNTDYTAEGIVDTAFTGAGDPYLLPFQQGIAAGADLVMVSLAVYPRVDSQPAAFSSAMIQGLLRGSLGFQGVVISDDMGAAAAVADRTPAERALAFLRAGGDVVLTVQPSDIAPMTQAVLATMAKDSAFAASVEASAQRVLALKRARGLLR